MKIVYELVRKTLTDEGVPATSDKEATIEADQASHCRKCHAITFGAPQPNCKLCGHDLAEPFYPPKEDAVKP